MCVQAFRPELAVESLDEGILGRLSGPGEVENDVVAVSPQIEIAGDKLAALVDTDRLRITELSADRSRVITTSSAR